jgi:3-oxoacyl-(acyl-carrier-protein) synthase III
MSVPEPVLTNDDLSKMVDTNDQWIRERTGIRERHIARENQFPSTLGAEAALKALEVANVQPTDLDLIICATSSPEHIFPATACLIQDLIGADKAGAFDLSAACSGFIYALNMAAQSIRSGSIKTALVIGTEKSGAETLWMYRFNIDGLSWLRLSRTLSSPAVPWIVRTLSCPSTRSASPAAVKAPRPSVPARRTSSSVPGRSP